MLWIGNCTVSVKLDCVQVFYWSADITMIGDEVSSQCEEDLLYIDVADLFDICCCFT